MGDCSTEQSNRDENMKGFLQAEISRAMEWSEKYRKLWSTAAHVAAGLVVILTCLATGLQLYGVSTSLPSAMAAAAMVLTLLFHRKWDTYRTVHTDLRFLDIDLRSGFRTPGEIRNRLDRTFKDHDKAVLRSLRVTNR